MKEQNLQLRLFNAACYWPPNYETVKQLLAQGADVNGVLEGESILGRLLWEGQDNPYLMEMIAFLLQQGADPNVDTGEGFNCLFRAFLLNKPKVVSLLLNGGADPNCICQVTGESLLDWALGEQFFLTTIEISEEYIKNHDAIVALLLAHNAKSSRDLG
ncbi:Putative Ankyrin repeat protein [Croceitalea dokdonensis DOKDO 023]|uniref:Putative Ankyrin repeat protein n=1 Tax=Croceitalea dokdonensis DOKDO 023 TaxID=1300341 RepID=A0A0N8H4D9_9FLAO|nr:ankyrin repeat domain-containing protein [Croceitalea dokdonensis]KPM33100.1 Putative Ankyrin repeat protein [Croceitalea dokdonensis DOKDO 023]